MTTTRATSLDQQIVSATQPKTLSQIANLCVIFITLWKSTVAYIKSLPIKKAVKRNSLVVESCFRVRLILQPREGWIVTSSMLIPHQTNRPKRALTSMCMEVTYSISVACLVFPFSLLWPILLTCSGRASVTATAVSISRAETTMLRDQTTTTCTVRRNSHSTRFIVVYPMLVPGARCYKWTKPDALQFKWKNDHSKAIVLETKCTLFFVFPIESAQHVMLFLWIGSQNDRVFLSGSDSRSAGGDTVRIKRWVCNISSTVMCGSALL